VEYLEAKRDQLSEDSQRRINTNPLRVLDSKVDADLLADAPAPVDHLSPASADHFDQVKQGLSELGVPFQESPRLVRGLDYYTRTVFEYTSPSYGAAQDSLGGGGRYDGLAEQLGGPATPAVGFSLGLDRVVLALGDREEPPALDVFVITADTERRPQASALLAELRGAGLRADGLVRDASVKAQFKAADRSGAVWAVVVGEDKDQVVVRSMADGSEQVIQRTEVAAWLNR